VMAAVIAAAGSTTSLSRRSFGWRQPLGVGLGMLALSAPVVGLVWWTLHGSGDPVRRAPLDAVPVYMDEAADRDPANATLVLRGSAAEGYTAQLRRGHALSLGEEASLPSAADQRPFTDAVSALLAGPAGGATGDAVDEVAASGSTYVFAPAPVDPALAAALDATGGLTPASAEAGGRAWRVEPSGAAGGPGVHEEAGRGPARPLLLVLQGVAVAGACALAAPTTRRRP
jgi:hypothetical protein